MCGAALYEQRTVVPPPTAFQPQPPGAPGSHPAAPIPSAPVLVEPVLGHLPAEYITERRGAFGGRRRRPVNLVITSTRLLCLDETEQTNTTWLSENERLDDDVRRTGVPWRVLIDHYRWDGPQWAEFYQTPPDALLAADRGNWDVPMAAIVEATITLDDELDRLDLLMDNGQVLRFTLFNLVGVPASRFLTRALGANRVRLGSATPP